MGLKKQFQIGGIYSIIGIPLLKQIKLFGIISV
jgi:hypothetical protein